MFFLGGLLGGGFTAYRIYAQTLIVVVLIVVNFFGFLVIAPYPTMRF